MNHIKFTGTMKAAEKAGLINKNDEYWKNLEIIEGDSYYAIVKGKVPLEVALIIYNKYPENQYGIRVEGGRDNYDPKEWAKDDEYQKEADSYPKGYTNHFEIEERYNSLQSNLKKRPDENKYIGTYHIDTKEGLIILLAEMKDYYLRKHNQPETAVEKVDKVVAKATEYMVKEVNPTITAYDWMQEDENNKDLYNEPTNNVFRKELTETFKDVLAEFDKAVNPFINNDIKIDSAINYTKKVQVEGYTFNKYNGKSRENSCHLSIYDKEKTHPDFHNFTEYFRVPDGFSFILEYSIQGYNMIRVIHYFTSSNDHELGKGEIISVEYLDYLNHEKTDIRLNISNWRAGETYGDKNDASIDQLTYVYDKLIEATEYAKKITIDNMAKQNEKVKIKK
ncbi:MAG: hypothetical protein IK137_01525 [Bacilli bacterium]|nr:hypothetical protein [Bacilli bacterium]